MVLKQFLLNIPQPGYYEIFPSKGNNYCFTVCPKLIQRLHAFGRLWTDFSQTLYDDRYYPILHFYAHLNDFAMARGSEHISVHCLTQFESIFMEFGMLLKRVNLTNHILILSRLMDIRRRALCIYFVIEKQTKQHKTKQNLPTTKAMTPTTNKAF